MAAVQSIDLVLREIGAGDICAQYDVAFELKYHYIDTLKISPGTLSITPVILMDDPVPFIRIENGDCDEFTIYNE